MIQSHRDTLSTREDRSALVQPGDITAVASASYQETATGQWSQALCEHMRTVTDSYTCTAVGERGTYIVMLGLKEGFE